MAKDFSTTNWHGIPRKDIPWFPTINNDKCIGCQLCYVSCGRLVFEYVEEKHKVKVERQYNCMVGCSTCSTVCPTEAITFPSKDLIQKVEREHKIFTEVRKEAKAKREKVKIEEERAKVESELAKVTKAMKFEIAGAFGDKQFLLKLQEIIKDNPFDIVNLQLHVPTVKGSLENTPSFMSFELVSTEYADITEFLPTIRLLIKENQFVLVNENKI